jgi:uncharacterized membrane protein
MGHRTAGIALQVCLLGFAVLAACSSDDKPKTAPARLRDAAVSVDVEATVADAATADASSTPDAASTPSAAAADSGATATCDAVAPTSCSDPTPHYADVQPIFARRCVSCHDGSGEEWSLADYEHVADWFEEIRGELLTCMMPPVGSGASITVAERQAILLWLRCDYPK